jgi:hypothetical protein
VTQPDTTPNPPQRVSGWVKAFVVFHLFAVIVWTLPKAPDSVKAGRISATPLDSLLAFNDVHFKTSPVRFYMSPTGLWQFWDMFAPNPSPIDYYGTAVVTYQDGTAAPYPLPRVADATIPQKILAERFRKYFERVHPDSGKFLWISLAQSIALRSFTNPANPPIEVRLTRHFKRIVPPGEVQPRDYESYTFFVYRVDPTWLKEHRS